MTQKQSINLDIAKDYHNSGQLQKSLEKYIDILKIEPNNYEALSHLGCLCMQMDKNERAIELLINAISIKKNIQDNSIPQDWYAWLVGLAFTKLERFEDAADCYKKKNPDPYIENQYFDELLRLFVHNGRFPIISKI